MSTPKKPVLLKDLRIEDLKKLLKTRNAKLVGNKEKLQGRLKSLLRDNGIEDPESFDFRAELYPENATVDSSQPSSSSSSSSTKPARERRHLGNY